MPAAIAETAAVMPRVESRSPKHIMEMVALGLALVASVPAALGGQASVPAAKGEPTVVAQFELPSMTLASAQARVWPHHVEHDHGVMLGGIFSGLSHAPGDPENVFYCVSDRGPNDEIVAGSERRRRFLVPEYSPIIYRIAAEGSRIRILSEIGLRTRHGRAITGLPNLATDEAPYGYTGRYRLDVDPNGLDIEGLAVAPDHTFWLADEYRPSLVNVGRDGTVLARWIPRGVTLRAETNVEPVFPPIYAMHRANRGFESVALSPDASRLVAILESPLEFPDQATGRASRMLRMIVLDTHRRMAVAEHVYVLDDASERGGAQDDERVSDAVYVNRATLLVVERCTGPARIYRVDLKGATNILGRRWSNPDDPAGALERLAPGELSAAGIVPVHKTLVADLEPRTEIPAKIEGVAIVNPMMIAVGNDNDFGFAGLDSTGRVIPNHIPTVLTFLKLPHALPVER